MKSWLIRFCSVVACAILSACNASNIFITPTPSYTPTPLFTATPIYTSTPRPTATPILTATPRSLSTPVTDFKKVEYSRCNISVEIPADYESNLDDDGKLVLYSLRNQVIPSFQGVLECRATVGKARKGLDQIFQEELFIAMMASKDLEGTDMKPIKMPTLLDNPLTTENGAKLFYFVYSITPTDYGATVVDRMWKFTIIGVLPGSPGIVVDLIFGTDTYMNEDSLIHIVRSIAPTKE